MRPLAAQTSSAPLLRSESPPMLTPASLMVLEIQHFPLLLSGENLDPLAARCKEIVNVCLSCESCRVFPSTDAVRPKPMPARRCSLAGLSPAEGRPPHTGKGMLWHMAQCQSGHLDCSPLTVLKVLVQGSLRLRRGTVAMVIGRQT